MTSLWAVTMVRDELDILPFTLCHLLAEGVDQFIIADNRSTDGTFEWLNDFAATHPVTVVDDPVVGYYQSKKMTALYETASKDGADWVLPFDADEIWYHPDGRTLHEVLDTCDADLVVAKALNYYPTSWDDQTEANPVRRMVRRSPRPVWAKVILRNHIPDVVIETGNHNAHSSFPLTEAYPGLEIGHFPWRSPEQFERKARNGFEALCAAPDRPYYESGHWRQLGRLIQGSGSEGLRAEYLRSCLDPPIDLEAAPVPWRG